MTQSPFIAVDIGNSRTKLAVFSDVSRLGGTGLPEPDELLVLEGEPGTNGTTSAALADWLATVAPAGAPLVTSSVSRPRLAALSELLAARGEAYRLRPLAWTDLPLQVGTEVPAKTGMDRLVAAVAANKIRRPERAAIVVDLGTAITVDYVMTDGTFAGGAILPGLALSARALAEGTDALPHVAFEFVDASPDAVGTNTQAAIEAGLYWGTVGAIRELIARIRDRLVTPPQVYVTGGASPQIARLVGSTDYTVRHIPHLVLCGIALVAGHLATREGTTA